jgi:hypothetical protein
MNDIVIALCDYRNSGGRKFFWFSQVSLILDSISFNASVPDPFNVINLRFNVLIKIVPNTEISACVVSGETYYAMSGSAFTMRIQRLVVYPTWKEMQKMQGGWR